MDGVSTTTKRTILFFSNAKDMKATSYLCIIIIQEEMTLEFEKSQSIRVWMTFVVM